MGAVPMAPERHIRTETMRHASGEVCHYPQCPTGAVELWGACACGGEPPLALPTDADADAWRDRHLTRAERLEREWRSNWIAAPTPPVVEVPWDRMRATLARLARAEADAVAYKERCDEENSEDWTSADWDAAEKIGMVVGFVAALAILRGLPEDHDRAVLWAVHGLAPGLADTSFRTGAGTELLAALRSPAEDTEAEAEAAGPVAGGGPDGAAGAPL